LAKENMIRKKAGDVEWLEFEIFADEPQLVHGVFLRQGMNLGEALNVQRVAFCHQVHSDAVAIVEEPERVQECDGLVTHQTDLGLIISHADCQAAIFYDPIHRALANVHSGWRGNVKNIYRATVQKMVEVYRSKPQDLLVGISPSLGPDNAEFKNYREEFPQTFWEFQVRPEYFDLWAIARYQLEECGILSHHIQIAEICTFANPQDYFSYRRDKTTKRHATVAMIKTF
jgi:YfiH family protein